MKLPHDLATSLLPGYILKSLPVLLKRYVHIHVNTSTIPIARKESNLDVHQQTNRNNVVQIYNSTQTDTKMKLQKMNRTGYYYIKQNNRGSERQISHFLLYLNYKS